jgi:NitT/TauT family transport system substrate-binding protein
MYKNLIYFTFFALFFASCSSLKDDKPIVISTNAWVGYSPLFYAREMGWLDKANIKLLSVVSLGENMHLYSSGASDVFTGTQHEFNKLRDEYPDIIPIMLFDQSDGGDAVMSNRTIVQLQKSSEKIEVYLEMDSINEELLKYFLKHNHIAEDKIIRKSRVQDEIQLMNNTSETPPTIIVTYDPYNMALAKHGFTEVASTKTNNDLFVVDAMYVSSKLYYDKKDNFEKLNAIMKRSILALQKNPKDFYQKVKPYLDNPTYDEFTRMLGNIKWIHEKPSTQLQQRLEEIQFPSKDIMK